MSGDRIKVIGGPWPERHGCSGRIVDDELDPQVYPRHGRARHEAIILLDADPIASWPNHDIARGWSCVLDRADIEVVG